jgi:hypothetical protein
MAERVLVDQSVAASLRDAAAESRSDSATIRSAFRIATGRFPDSDEVHVLTQLLDKQRVRFEQDPELADKLLRVGESPRNPSFRSAELAAWTTVASVLLSLDETITRE